MKRLRVSIVVPAHNEEENIVDIITAVERIRPDEVVAVDDCSTDRTGALLARLRRRHRNLRVVTRKGERGFEKALKAGLAAARMEVVVPVMGDLCDRLSDVPKMVAKVGEGYDIVAGSRHIPGGGIENSEGIKATFSWWVGRLAHWLGGMPMHDVTNAFKAYRRSAIRGIPLSAKSFDVSMELTVKAYGRGAKLGEVPTVWTGRKKGASKFKVFKYAPGYAKWTALSVWCRFARLR